MAEYGANTIAPVVVRGVIIAGEDYHYQMVAAPSARFYLISVPCKPWIYTNWHQRRQGEKREHKVQEPLGPLLLVDLYIKVTFCISMNCIGAQTSP